MFFEMPKINSFSSYFSKFVPPENRNYNIFDHFLIKFSMSMGFCNLSGPLQPGQAGDRGRLQVPSRRRSRTFQKNAKMVDSWSKIGEFHQI